MLFRSPGAGVEQHIHFSPGCLLPRDIGDISQGHLTVNGDPEIETGGLYLCQPGLARRESGLACLARDLELTNKPVLECTGLQTEETGDVGSDADGVQQRTPGPSA